MFRVVFVFCAEWKNPSLYNRFFAPNVPLIPNSGTDCSLLYPISNIFCGRLEQNRVDKENIGDCAGLKALEQAWTRGTCIGC